MLEIKRYKRTGYTFSVEAVLVTETNLREVAFWAGGEVCATYGENRREYVRVYTSSQKDPIRKAYPGNYIVKHDHGAKKVYAHDSFHKSFDEIQMAVAE